MTVVTPEPRAEIERFIAERFRDAYGARVSHFCAHLLGARDRAGAWQAAAGYTPAGAGALYLEHYLDRPVEKALAALLGERVPRGRIVEVGNLASAGGARRFLPALGRHLAALGHRWVVFTATREVRDLLQGLSYPAHPLAPARPERLPDRGAGWGSYYAHEPSVMAGRLA
jgi:hypothetical protein